MSNSRNQDLEWYAQVFRALSNPNRLRLFLRLASCCAPGMRCCADSEASACVGELGEDLGIAPSTVSHHIRELRQAGLIRMQRQGKHVECWIEPAALRKLEEFFKQPAEE